ncbi:MAG TPA: hypothetical protein VFS85_13235 [Dongiaceae bacterium]|nr:hypothetical protein [Dongiaceae bacterium]HSE73718.1 hypothetical protein [Dongiaceae bacterium]
MRPTILCGMIAVAIPLTFASTMTASAAPDPASRPADIAPISRAVPKAEVGDQLADVVTTRPKQGVMITKDAILYNIISDQISEMRRKSALPAVMCIAESNGDGTAETVSRTLMTRLQDDNARVADSLFVLKAATECQSAGKRLVDRETHERAMMIVAGPMESDMKTLMAGCGDYVGGFVRASDDSDFDFYSVHGGDVARKLGCELAQ